MTAGISHIDLGNSAIIRGNHTHKRLLFQTSVHEDIAQPRKRRIQREGGNSAKAANRSLLVQGANLIEQDEAVLCIEKDRDAPRCRLIAGGHWRGNYRSQMIVHLWRRDNDARAVF
jgi:hypothetical protein